MLTACAAASAWADSSGTPASDAQAAAPDNPRDEGTDARDDGSDPRNESTDARNRALVASLMIFGLAIFVGFEVITKVPPTLHTPLMSGSNAISGITIVGALVATGATSTEKPIVTFIGALALVLATINVIGGFMVTHRMLAMFKKR